MKHTYHIHGMTCQGCRKHVEETLSKAEGVSNVSVNLEEENATIEMKSHIPLEKFQDVLKNDGGTYSIHKLGEKPQTKEKKICNLKGKEQELFIVPCIAKAIKPMKNLAIALFAEWT